MSRDIALHRLANFLLRFATPNYRAALDATYRLGLHNLDEMASWSCPHCGRTIASESLSPSTESCAQAAKGDSR